MNKIFTIKNFLSKEECEFILNKCLTELKLKPADVYGGSKDVRKSNVAGIDDLDFLNEKLKKILKIKLLINGHTVTNLSRFQFTQYEIGGYYNWHIDSSTEIYNERFYSTIIQLNNEYVGGDFEIVEDKNTVKLEKGLGNLFLFPSSRLHRITPIIDGTRYSLVNWVGLEKIETQVKSLI
jgi:PKHD-type hydroxylase